MTSGSYHRKSGRLRPGLLGRAFRRQWLEVTSRSTLLAGVILACLYVTTLSRYEASILLRVDPAGEDATASDTALETLVRLAGSRQVLDGAADDPSLADLPWFRDSARVRRVTSLPLIEIIAQGTPDQAPRIVAAVAASLERIRTEAIRRDLAASREHAAQRLQDLQARSGELDRSWQDTVAQRAAAVAQGSVLGLDLHAMATERVAVRVGLVEAERELATPTPHPLDLAQLQPVNGAIINLRPVGWFWVAVAAGPVVLGSVAAMLALAVGVEARRVEAEAHERRRSGVGPVPAATPMLVAIELVHGDWRPRRHPSP